MSCNEELTNPQGLPNAKENTLMGNASDPNPKTQYLSEFATILSKAIYNNMDVRKFIKENALKRFDENYDVLYYSVKDESINDKSFRDILIDYSSEKEIKEIERNVPLLNILVPEISFF